MTLVRIVRLSVVTAMLTAMASLPLAVGHAADDPPSEVGPSSEDGDAAGDGETPPYSVGLRSVAAGLTVPVEVAQPDDGTDRLFIVDQVGHILVTDGGGSVEVFLDLSEDIVEIDPGYDERGVLGLAFHPGYADNGRFFVYYSAPLREGAPENWDHTSHVSEFAVSADDPNRGDPDSERLVLAVDQPYHNHNGGQMLFGHDGLLYVALGDGGNGGDVDEEGDDRGRPEIGHGQDFTTILGSVIRIDVDGAQPYEIPEDNPFVGEEGVEEIFAFGFRNPWGLSIDAETGDIYAADAGQARFEEVSRVELGGNYGWRVREGTHCFDPDNFLLPPAECPDTDHRGDPLIDPVIEYERGPESGSVITQGVLARDPELPELEGRFVVADYATIRFIPTGIVYVANPTDEGLWPLEQLDLGVDSFDRFVLGVGQDADGGVYLLTTESGGPSGSTGEVFRLQPSDSGVEVDWHAWWPLMAAVVLGAAAGALLWRSRRSAAVEGDQS